MRESPMSWKPCGPADIVGPAGPVAKKLLAKVAKVKNNGRGPIKLLLYGSPGVGKTTTAEIVADELGGSQ